MTERLHLILIGPPGAGKSTVAGLLVRQAPLTVIATGQRLRQEIAAGTPIGRTIGPLLEQGHFAPDTLMDRLMRQWLREVPADHGFLLDGYPRNPEQALALEAMLADRRRPLTGAIALEIDDAEAVRRLGGRRICRWSGEPFTLHVSDEAAVARCAALGGVLATRDDDRPEVIAERLRVYERETEPLISFYSRRGLLHHIDAAGSPEQVAERVLAHVRRDAG
ncbi:MAG TPA: nucleoside monophosphate kinase [Chloroflexaceae bacterium]|nr:nucleoside monophosphate kinase [Chloroflexaceae bacterium]